MEFLELAKKRYSVRSFLDKPIEQEKLDLILEAGRVAPTACNLQPQRIFVIRGESTEKLKRSTKCHFDAPTAMLVCCDRNANWKRKYDGKESGDIDAAIVTTHMMMQATELGIGTTWVMHFNPEVTRKEFNLPENLEPVVFLVMGYPAEDAKPMDLHMQFRDQEDIVTYL